MTSRLHRVVYRLASASVAVSLAAALAACSSPPVRFYTLDTAGIDTAHKGSSNPSFWIQVTAVVVPEQIDRSQLVVQESATQVDVLEDERWASPLNDEISRALLSRLSNRLNTVDVSDLANPPRIPVYRMNLSVRRFESYLGKRAAIDPVWNVRSLANQAVMTCHSYVSVVVKSGYDALVADHCQAIDQLAVQIARGVGVIADTAQRGKADSAARLCPGITPHPQLE